MNIIEVYIDGGCLNNGRANSVGGWGVFIPSENVSLFGGDENTTNNRMEITAGIKALEWIIARNDNNIYHIYTDSRYVKDGITSWIIKWRKNNFQKIKNPDLWKTLDRLNRKINHINWYWVKGHADSVGNNEADRLATLGINSFKENRSMNELIDTLFF